MDPIETWHDAPEFERMDAKIKALEIKLTKAEERELVLVEALEELLSKFPKEKTDYSGVGWCAGCGALHWCTGNPGPREPCKPDCVLQKAISALEWREP